MHFMFEPINPASIAPRDFSLLGIYLFGAAHGARVARTERGDRRVSQIDVLNLS